MTSSSNTRVLVATCSAAMLLLAGCGGGSGAETAPNTPKQIAADKALATRAVLKPGDLPVGYKASPHKQSPDDDVPQPVLQTFATCAKVPKSKVATLLNSTKDPTKPSADSPDFDSQDATTGVSTSFQNSVELDRSSKDLGDFLEILGAKSALKCWRGLFNSVFEATAPSGGSVQDVTAVALPSPSIGDESLAFGIRVTVAGSQRTVKAFLDFYLVRRGRAGISLFASGIGERVDSSLALSLLQTVDDRLKDAT